MLRRRSFAVIPSAVVGIGQFLDDVRKFLMDFGLTGEELGLWRGVVITLSVVVTIRALYPDAVRLSKWAKRIVYDRRAPAVVSPDIRQVRAMPQSDYDTLEEKDPRTLYLISEETPETNDD